VSRRRTNDVKQDDRTVRRKSDRRPTETRRTSNEGPSENAADNVSPELRSDGDGAYNAATAMALHLATLLLLRRCCSYNAAGATRCGTPAATLLLQRTAALLVLRQVTAAMALWRGKLLQRWRCCCNAVVAARCGGSVATLLLQSVATVLQRCCCSALRRCCCNALCCYCCGTAAVAMALRHCCCRGATGATLLVRGAAASAWRGCWCGAVLPRRCGAAAAIVLSRRC
jgi:hypothetical protein